MVEATATRMTAWRRGLLNRGVTLQAGLDRRADNFLFLRIVAASLVIYGHASALSGTIHKQDLFIWLGWGHYSGDIAVDAFFLISGFLVTGSFIRRHDLYHFLKARFLRVVPAFILNVSVLALVYGAALTTLSLAAYYASPHTWSYITQNLKYSSHMVWDLPGVFEDMKRATINGSQWTLPAEVRMYIFLGILGAVGVLRKKRIALVVLLGLYIVGLVVPNWLPLHPSSWLRLAGFFLIGVVAYEYRERITVSWQLVLALVWLAYLTRGTPAYGLTFPLAVAGFVFAFAYLTPPWHWLERFGDPSYGIYLWGWPVEQLVVYFFPHLGLAPFVALAVTAAILAGYASWWGLEKQALRLK